MEALEKGLDNAIEHKFHDKYDSKCSTCFGENLLAHSRTTDSSKCNGLHSGTRFEKFLLGRGVTQEWHEHPDTGELIVINCWYVMNGEDDVDHDFEVVKVYSRIACELAKENKGHNINKPVYE